MRKVLTTAAVALFAISTLSAISAAPASAAMVESGQNCSKVNATKRYTIDGERYVYKCVRNPFYKKTRLTWTLQECLDGIKNERTTRTELARQKTAGAGADIITNLESALDYDIDYRKMACAAGL